MAIHLSSIEARIQAEFSFPSKELQHILHEVREAVSTHIHGNKHRPRDVFQMRIAGRDESMQKLPPDKQSYLVINFGEHPIEPGYAAFLQSYYGKVIFFHFYLNHSIIL